MVNLIRRIFIKDFNNVNNPNVRKKHGILSALTGIIFNLLLFIFKLTIGILSFSFSIISDAFNNLTDLLSSFVNLFGFKLAGRPADKRHPYGHERIEYISGMIIAFVMVSLAIALIYHSITNLINPTTLVTYSIYAFVILGVSILIKLFLAYFYHGIGKAISSEAIKAQMQDSFNDALCTLGVLIAALVNYFYPNLYWLDASISLLVALFILYSGIKLIIETASPLIGSPLDEKQISSIKKDILNYEGVLGVHDLLAHTYGHTKAYVTAHVEVDGYQSLLTAHDLIDRIENELGEKYQIELTIHIDPIDSKNKDIEPLKDKITKLLSIYDECVSVHDLRISKNKVLSFDILISDKCHLDDEKIKKIITDELGDEYKLHIKVDHRF